MARRSIASTRYRRSNLGPLMRLRLALNERWSAAAAYAHRLRNAARAIPVLGSLLSLTEGITPLGWGILATGVVAMLAGWQHAWMEIAGIGTTFVVTVLIALIWSIGRSGYAIDLNLERTRVSVGERALGELTVTNPTSRALPAARIELQVGAGAASFTTTRLAAGDSHAEPFGIATTRRGIIPVGPASSVRGDALGLVRRTQTWSEATELYIHPRTVNVSATAIGFIRDVEGVTTQDLSSADVSFHALRDYIPGDDRRNIHWKTTARTGKLMVRQFEETRRSHLLIILDLDQDAWGSDEEFEDGVSAAASLARATMTESKEVSIVTQAGQLKTPSVMHALDSLSGVERVIAAERLPELTHKAGNDVPQASVAVVITGSRTAPNDMHVALAHLPLNMIVAAIRLDASQTLDLRTIGGFPVVTAPGLDDVSVAIWKALG